MNTDSEIADRNKRIRNLYSTGLYTHADIAARVGVSPQSVNRGLDRQSRADAAKKRGRTKSQIADRNKRIRNLYSTGLYTYDDIAARVGVTCATVNAGLDSLSRTAAAKNRGEATTGQRNRKICDLWMSGEHSTLDIAKLAGLTRQRVYQILKDSAVSVLETTYRNPRIAQMHSEGRTIRQLSQRFNLKAKTIKKILYEAAGSTGRHAAICKRCGSAFVANRADHVYCTTTCSERAKRIRKVCLVCLAAFRTDETEQICCSRRCSAAHRNAPLIDRDVEIMSLREKGHSRSELAARYNLAEGHISRISSPNTDRGSLIAAIRSKREVAAKRKAGSWESSRARTSRLLALKRGSA